MLEKYKINDLKKMSNEFKEKIKISKKFKNFFFISNKSRQKLRRRYEKLGN